MADPDLKLVPDAETPAEPPTKTVADAGDIESLLRSPTLGGVSSATWLIAWIESMLWLVYGVGIVDVALVVAGVVGVAMSSVILVKLAVSGQRPLDAIAPRATIARWRKAQPSLS